MDFRTRNSLRWLAVAMLATTALSDAAVAQGILQQAQASAVRNFEIPPQPLASALTQFGQQSGWQVSVNGMLLQGKTSPGVTGSMMPEQAVTRLFAGTGLTPVVSGSTVTVSAAGASGASGVTELDPVRVQASTPLPRQAEIGQPARPYAGGVVNRDNRLGMLGNRDYMDTPFNVTTYTSKAIQDQQARTLIEVVAIDPTIRSAYAQGSSDDRVLIRGFQVNPRDFAFNGLYGINAEPTVGMAGIDRLEIFHGPSAMLSGMAPRGGGIGGMINFVPKRAPDDGIIQATANYMSSANFGGQLDVGQRFFDKRVGVRANVAFNGGPTPVYNNTDSLLQTTLGLDYRGEDTRLDADFGYLDRNIYAGRGFLTLGGGAQFPAAPSGFVNFGQPWENYHGQNTYGMLRFEHDFTPALTAYAKVGGRHTTAVNLLTFNTITSALGNLTSIPTYSNYYGDSVSADVGVRGRFVTGPFRHEAVLSGNFYGEQNGSRFTVGFAPGFLSNLYAPIYTSQPTVPAAVSAPAAISSNIQQTSLGVIDAISVADDRIQVIGGVRFQRVATTNYNVNGITTAATPGNEATAVTPSVSVLVRPWSFLTLYTNYIQALEQGPVAPVGSINVGTAFPAFVSRQFEVGAKMDFGNIGGTLSAFSINRPIGIINPTTFRYGIDGEQNNRGIELTVFGEPAPGLKPLAGLTFLEATQVNTAGGLNNGRTAPFVPNMLATVGLDWDTPFVRGLSVNGRVIYTGASYYDAANTQPLQAWTRVDLGAKYVFERSDGKPLALRAQVQNVGNASYLINAGAGLLSVGLPRTYMVSLTADF